MSKHRVIVLSVINNQLTVTEAAARFGLSRQRIYQLLARYRQGGIDAVEPRSHRPKTNPRATSTAVRQRIIDLRVELTKAGLDAGPVSIASHLKQESHHPPSTSTIPRILHTKNLITPEPKKRPKSSLGTAARVGDT
ncbi:MAG TPA: helix-turn-helix domain-containing protein [Beutenbergiaceae bacterium]|nr:helix-turn-helix domain-containing protein [Beutenbergiaceae bacterium]